MTAKLIIFWGLFIVAVFVTAGFFKEELRHFRNAVSLDLCIVLFVYSLKCIWDVMFPPTVPYSEGGYYITVSGEIQSDLMIIVGCLAVLLGFYLIINGIYLMYRERISFAHMLPVIFGVFTVLLPFGKIVPWLILIFELTSSPLLNNILHYAARFAFLMALYFPFMASSYAIYSAVYKRLASINDPDYVLVLGASIRGEDVTPLLARRLDKAIELHDRFGGKSMFVLSGGQGKDEIVSEAYAMKKYLIEKRIPEDKIIVEDKSTNTYENMKFTKELLDKRGKDYKCVFVTNDFHVLRGSILAFNIGLDAHGTGCSTAGYYMPAAVLREVMAFIFRYKKVALFYSFFSLISLFFIY